MKICRIISAYSPHSFGGADLYAEKISREIVKKGNPTVIITINPNRGDEYEEDKGTKIYRFHPFNVSTVHKIGKESILRQGVWTLLDIYSYYSYCKIKRILQNEKPDIVHLHTPVDLTLSAFSAVKSLGLPLVYTLHDYLLLCRRVVLLHANGGICTEKNINPFCRMYRQFSKNIVNKSVDLVISPSEFTLKLYKENGFFINTKAKVLPHGIDLSRFQDNSVTRNRKENTFNILYTGSLTRHKGVHILIKAFRMIQNLNIRLHIVGEGIYEIELKRLAKNDERIIFHGKFLNQDLEKFYNEADIVVVPSIWYEVRSNVIPEAFRASVPVIGSRIGAIPEFIRDNYNGFLFDPTDEWQLKKIIIDTIEHPDKLKILGKNAFESVKEYEMSKYITRLIKIYEEAFDIYK